MSDYSWMLLLLIPLAPILAFFVAKFATYGILSARHRFSIDHRTKEREGVDNDGV